MSPAAFSSSPARSFSRVSGDLPFGTLASPGAGMLPKLVIGLMMCSALILLLRAPARARRSPRSPGASCRTRVRVIAVTAAGIALYEPLGFLLDHVAAAVRPAVGVERKPLLMRLAVQRRRDRARLLSVRTLLKSPLPRRPVRVLAPWKRPSTACCSASRSPSRPDVLLVCLPRLPGRHAGRRAAGHRAARRHLASCCR